MAQITVDIGGYTYKLACRDGEEQRLEKLANYVDSKVRDLFQALGQVSESRMLLMASLLVADELFEARDSLENGYDGGAAKSGAGDAASAFDAAEMADFLAEAAARAEEMTSRLEEGLNKA